ncbi:hypothetical protein XENTR_v10018285 [Xenopus tropicalis]|nr:hypothetical protein XENTR_v10018285 [Xenopus tropicalis]
MWNLGNIKQTKESIQYLTIRYDVVLFTRQSRSVMKQILKMYQPTSYTLNLSKNHFPQTDGSVTFSFRPSVAI